MTTPDTGRLRFPAVDASADPARHAEYLALVAAVVGELRAEARGTLRLRPGAHLLDAGCGAGEHALELASEVLPGGRVVGVDVSHAMIERAQDAAEQARSPVEFTVGDVRSLPLADASFDAVRCERVLQHLAPSDAAAAVSELARVTRPGGTIQLIDVDHYQTAFTAADTELARRLVVEGRTSSLYPDVGLFLHELLTEAGLGDVAVVARAGTFRDLAVFDTIQQLGQSLAEMVAARPVSASRAQALHDDLLSRDRGGSFLATMIAYIATGQKP